MITDVEFLSSKINQNNISLTSSGHGPEVSSAAGQSAAQVASGRRKSDDAQRRYNLIFTNIPEAPDGTKFKERLISDHNSVSSICQSIENPVSSASIKDCYRLGKYDKDRIRPRPLLVKFNSSANTTMILESKSRLRLKDGKPISVKRDIPTDQRSIMQLLLKERRHLIDAGVNRKLIRIYRDKLFINSKIAGYVQDNSFFSISRNSPKDTTEPNPTLPVTTPPQVSNSNDNIPNSPHASNSTPH